PSATPAASFISLPRSSKNLLLCDISNPLACPVGTLADYVGSPSPLDQTRPGLHGPPAPIFHESPTVPLPPIDPIGFALGPIVIRWYALAYLAGIFLGVGYGTLLVRRKSLWVDGNPPMTPDELFDFIFWAVIGIIVGGRLGYVIF